MMGMASWSLMSGSRQESSFRTTWQDRGLLVISMRSLDTTDWRILALTISDWEMAGQNQRNVLSSHT